MNLSVLAVCLLAAAGRAQDDPLQRAQTQALAAAARTRTTLQAHKDFERLKKDLRYISEELDREIVGPKKDVSGYSTSLKARVAGLRQRGNIDPKLQAVLDRLDALYATMDQRQHIDQYPRGFVKHVSEELRWLAENAASEAQLLADLDAQLDVPIDAEAFLPTDLTVEKFKKLGPIRIFIAKHRIRRPKAHVKAGAQDIVKSKHLVQTGVEVEGVVTWHGGAIDQDYTFNFGDLHIEMTPEWRLIVDPSIPRPKTGDRIRIKGWTYFDAFHKAEEEYDPADEIIGLRRKTLWEVHPVQSVEILQPAAP